MSQHTPRKSTETAGEEEEADDDDEEKMGVQLGGLKKQAATTNPETLFEYSLRRKSSALTHTHTHAHKLCLLTKQTGRHSGVRCVGLGAIHDEDMRKNMIQHFLIRSSLLLISQVPVS